ncbi:hypothetical protein, partial [Romboutsia sp. 13368]
TLSDSINELSKNIISIK